MADFIIAAETAKFGQPEVKLGVAPGMGGSQRLARAVGKAKAMDMCLSARMMDVHEAERAGLVSRVTPAAMLVEDAIKAAAEIASMPPLATIANKEMVNTAFEIGLSAGLLFERRLFNGLCATADKREGMAAFVEKHKGRPGPASDAHILYERNWKSEISAMTEAYIVSAVRTAGGRRNGALAGWHPVELAAEVLNATLDRAGIDSKRDR